MRDERDKENNAVLQQQKIITRTWEQGTDKNQKAWDDKSNLSKIVYTLVCIDFFPRFCSVFKTINL